MTNVHLRVRMHSYTMVQELEITAYIHVHGQRVGLHVKLYVYNVHCSHSLLVLCKAICIHVHCSPSAVYIQLCGHSLSILSSF